MMKSYKRSLSSIVAVAVLITCAVVTFGLARNGTSYAHSPSAKGFRGVTDYALPGGADPWGTAFDSAGNIWVAAPGCDPQPRCAGAAPGKLDVFNPHHHQWLASISLPGNYSQPLFIAFDHAGLAWFTMPMTNAIGVYNPSNNSFRQWGLPSASSGSWDIAIDRTGNIWITEHYSYKVASFNPATGHFKEYATSSTISAPYGVTVDGNNNVWFTENVDAVAKIGRISSHGHLTEYSVRNYNTAGTGLTPHMITVDPSGNVWWSEGWVGSIGVLNVAASRPGTNAGVTEFQYNGNGGTHTSGISAAPNGGIWLDDALLNTVGYFNGHSFSFVNVPGLHPHDGLNVDANGHVWFDEEFSNALGRVN